MSSEIQTEKKHKAPVRALAFSADGQFLVSGSDDATCCHWNASSGKLLRTGRPTRRHWGVTSVAFFGDNSAVALIREAVRKSKRGETQQEIWDLFTGDSVEVGKPFDRFNARYSAVLPGLREVMFGGNQLWFVGRDGVISRQLGS